MATAAERTLRRLLPEAALHTAEARLQWPPQPMLLRDASDGAIASTEGAIASSNRDALSVDRFEA